MLAQETLAICERGTYTSPTGERLSIEAAMAAARAGTTLYTPRRLRDLLYAPPLPSSEVAAASIELRPETSMEAARRLCLGENRRDVLVLNFASARNPGGGFLGGSQAQEEALSRSSGLYPCLLLTPEYYEHHRRLRSCLYSDHMIYSPSVPFFRDDAGALLESPYQAAVVTAPAVNAGVVRRQERGSGPKIRDAMRQRIGLLLGLARHHGHETLVLGAWGCGVFRNDPRLIAELFSEQLRSQRFARAFDKVVFAIPGRGKGSGNFAAFDQILGAPALIRNQRNTD